MSNKCKKVSMIMPVFNAEHFLDAMMNSILNQDYQNIELIAVNDASTDGSSQKLIYWKEKFLSYGIDMIIATREKNGGLSAAINTGLTLYTGDYVCFPDADDWLYSNYISSLVDALENSPDCGWAMCNAEVFNEDSYIYNLSIPTESVYENDFYDMLSANVPHNAWLLLAKTEYFKNSVGEQILDSRLTQEWSILLPLSFYGNYKRVPKILYRYIKRPSSMATWSNGDVNDVIAHLDALQKLVIEVSSKLPLTEEVMYKLKLATELHYGFRIYETLSKGGRAVEADSVKKQLLETMRSIENGLSSVSSLRMNLEYATDILLGVREKRLIDAYENMRERLSFGYFVYGAGRFSFYLLDSLQAVFGLPNALWDTYSSGRELCGINVVKPDFTLPKRPVIIAIADSDIIGYVKKDITSNGFSDIISCQDVIDALRGFEVKRRKRGGDQKVVSMIMPIFNAESYLEYMLRSISAQNYDAIELIAVDDASNDRTNEILNHWVHAFSMRGFLYKIITRNENGGLCAAINEGLRCFSGEYVCFPDADDWLYPNYVSFLVKALECNPSYGWARCDAEWVREEEPKTRWRVIRNVTPNKSHISSFDLLLSYRTPISAWILMVRRNYILKCIPTREIYEFRSSQEFGLAFPLAYNGDYIAVNEILYRYIYHSRSSSNAETINGFERAQKYVSNIERTYNQVLSEMQLSESEHRRAVHIGNIAYRKLEYELYSKYNLWDKRHCKTVCAALLSELLFIAPRITWDEDVIFSQIIPLSELCLNWHLGVLMSDEEKMANLDSFAGYCIYGAGEAAQYLLPSLIDAYGSPLAVFDANAEGKIICDIPAQLPDFEGCSHSKVIVTIKDAFVAELIIDDLQKKRLTVFSYNEAVSLLCYRLLRNYPELQRVESGFEEWQKSLKDDTRIICWGAGRNTEKVLNDSFVASHLNKIDCFVDNDSSKHGTDIVISERKIPVRSPEYLSEISNAVILITANNYKDISCQIDKLTTMPYFSWCAMRTKADLDRLLIPFSDTQIRFILMNTPDYFNLGDHAIALAERIFLRKYFTNPIVEIGGDLCRSGMELLGNYVNDKDIICITGGGYMGTLWSGTDSVIRETVRRFPRNQIIVFPQSVFYGDSLEDKDELTVSQNIYNSHNHLLLCARDKTSMQFMSEYYPKCDHYLMPDMVLSIDAKSDIKRDGIGFCFRMDKEGVLSAEEQQSFYDAAAVVGEKSFLISNHAAYDSGITHNSGESAVRDKLREYQSCKLIVTDRLHGMVFCAITSTPCIVLDNSYHKNRALYDSWLKGLNYITFVENNHSDIVEIFRKMLSITFVQYNNYDYDNYYAKLANYIRYRIRGE